MITNRMCSPVYRKPARLSGETSRGICRHHTSLPTLRCVKLITLLCYLLMLSSCATTSHLEAPLNQTVSWAVRAQALSHIQSWDLTGVMAIRMNQESWTANWQWRQEAPRHYVISFIGPLGVGALTLTGSTHRVLLETSDGKKQTASQPEALLAEYLGWQLPVSNLYYWIRGLPAPGIPFNMEWDSYSHLSRLVQQGWVIEYLHYTSLHHLDIPSKMSLKHRMLGIKIIITQWVF